MPEVSSTERNAADEVDGKPDAGLFKWKRYNMKRARPLLLALLLISCSDGRANLDAPGPDAATDRRGPDAPPIPGNAVEVRVDLSAAVAELDTRFLSVAIDSSQVVGGYWWVPGGGSSGGVSDTRVDPFDFTQSRLRTLAAGLAPAYLRIGGSEADKLLYHMGDDPPGEAPEPYHFVLTRDQWDGVADFADAVGFDLFFTLNAGPGSRDPDGAWTPENAQALVDYSATRGIDVAVWELGNELNGYLLVHGPDGAVSGTQYAADLLAVRDLLDEVGVGGRIAGPSCAFWPEFGEMVPFMEEFMAAGGDALDVVTWHYYPQQSERCGFYSRPAFEDPYLMMQPDALDEVHQWATFVEELQAPHAPDAEIWLGESGNAQCGGQVGVSDRFVAGFWWVDQLGLLARRGHRVAVRQALAGADYGLIDEYTLEPRPDYWASLLWKRLVGARVLDVSSPADTPLLRVYALCAPSENGAVTLLALNLDRDAPATLVLPDLDGRDAARYVVTAEDLLGGRLWINGAEISWDGGDALPDLSPEVDAGWREYGLLDLPSASYAFVVFPRADAPACQ